MSKKPTPLTAETVATGGTEATAGLLLVTCTSCSWPTPSAVMTTPCEPLVVDIGRTKNDVGAGPGVSVICHRVVTAPAAAVIVTRVVSVHGARLDREARAIRHRREW